MKRLTLAVAAVFAVSVASPAMSAAVNTGQVTCGTTATLIAPERTGRRSIDIVQEGTTLVRLGGSGVTMSNGVPLPATTYSSFTINGGAAVYCIVATGSQLVSFVEDF